MFVTFQSIDPVSHAQHVVPKHGVDNIRRNIPLPVVTTKSPNRIPTRNSNSINDMAKTRMAIDSTAMESIEIIPNPQILSASSPQGNPISPSMKRESTPPTEKSQSSQPDFHASDDGSAVSSITEAGYDQEIVEELHMALTTLRAELQESRAEAARAVKVAEQAIQSAEKNSSSDWSSTVTHKAAEAAALAQKRSAEAMSRARVAEERFEKEQKNALIYKRQAEAAEEEAGYWQTRAAASEVHKAAISESLESERNRTASILSSKDSTGNSGSASNRALESELEVMRSALASKADEVKALRECLTEV